MAENLGVMLAAGWDVRMAAEKGENLVERTVARSAGVMASHWARNLAGWKAECWDVCLALK